MIGRQRQISGGLKKGIDRRRQGTAAAVPQNDDKLQAALQVFDRVSQAAEYVVGVDVAVRHVRHIDR